MPDKVPLDQIYTADEAAERLRLTTRALIKIARKHGLCSRFGRDYLFSESDILAIWQVLRQPPNSSSSPFVAPFLSDHQKFQKLVRATTKKGRGNQ